MADSELTINKSEFLKEIQLAIYRALEETYVESIMRATPVNKTGSTTNTAARWDFYPSGWLKYTLENTNGPVIGFLERGTGLYGPHKTLIVPKYKKALAWGKVIGASATGGKMYQFVRRSVKGSGKHKGFIAAIMNDPILKQQFNEKLKKYIGNKTIKIVTAFQ